MRRLSILMLVLLLIIGGCTKPPAETEEPSARVTAEPTPTPTPTPTPEATATPTPTPEPYRNPLNGMPMEEDISGKRPYAVMINNIIYALPPCGISNADIVYEVLAEGGITRMMAIFSDIHDAGVLGSIRSVRPYYLEIARSYDAITVHAGGSVPDSYNKIRDAGLDTIDGVNGLYGEGTAYYRDVNRMANGYEHSLFTNSDLVEEYTGVLGFPTEHENEIDYGLRFSSEENSAEKGESAANIQMKFAGYKTTDMKYSEADGVYYMTQYNQQYIDGNTWEPIGFTNVMVLFADTVTLADEYSHVDITLTGGGDGYFATGGKIIPIKWKRAGDGATFSYTTADGSSLIFAPGSTFVGIVPNADYSGCTYS